MDWLLSITTLFVNANLGWSKGQWWAWLIHAINGVLWVAYSFATEQYGFVALSFATIAIDIVSMIKSKINADSNSL